MSDATTIQGAGTLTRTPDGRYRVRFVRAFDHPVEDLWAAVSEPEVLDTWYPSKLRTSGVVGEPVTEAFESTDGTPPPETPAGVLTAYEPPRVFAYRTVGPQDSPYPGMRGTHDVRMEAAEGSDDAESVLTFIHDVETLESALSVLPGWHYCLEYLALTLGGPGEPTEENLERVKEYYQRAYGSGAVDLVEEP